MSNSQHKAGNSKVIAHLNQHLANLYGLYIKTHNYHWNVRGNHFYSLHQMFEAQYTDLAQAIDLIAEQIRQLGALVKADLAHFADTTTIRGGDEKADFISMLRDLLQDNKMMCKDLEAIIVASGEDEATKDIAIERLRVHSKVVWMLESSL